MINVPPALLAHPGDLQRLAGELLALRFDRARLTEALLRVQEAAREVAGPGPGLVLPTPAERAEIERQRAAERLARGEWRVTLD